MGAWLKIISYLGALAFLALGFADYLVELFRRRRPGRSSARRWRWRACVLFFFVHAAGVRWFGRIQVAMVALLGLSRGGARAARPLRDPSRVLPAVLHPRRGRVRGRAAAAVLPYAGFESLAQTAGEVRDSRRRLPGIFLRGLLATAAVYVLMSAVAFGVLPGERLQASPAPMTEVGARYLHAAAAAFVTLGAVMALATSLNATMLVPSRMALVLVRDGLAPRWIGTISERTGTPVLGLAATLAVSLALVLSGQVSLALNIAVFALVALYLLHSVALLLLPRWNPALFATVDAPIPLGVQRVAGVVSILSMAGLLASGPRHPAPRETRAGPDDDDSARASGRPRTSSRRSSWPRPGRRARSRPVRRGAPPSVRRVADGRGSPPDRRRRADAARPSRCSPCSGPGPRGRNAQSPGPTGRGRVVRPEPSLAGQEAEDLLVLVEVVGRAAGRDRAHELRDLRGCPPDRR